MPVGLFCVCGGGTANEGAVIDAFGGVGLLVLA